MKSEKPDERSVPRHSADSAFSLPGTLDHYEVAELTYSQAATRLRNGSTRLSVQREAAKRSDLE